MWCKKVGFKTVRAFSIPNMILYYRIEWDWVICLDFQGICKRVDDGFSFGIELIGLDDLGFDFEEVLTIETKMLDCLKKALIKMFLRDMLGLTNRTPQVPITMSDFEDNSNLVIVEQEEIKDLMAEGFNPSTSSSGQVSIDNLPVRDILDLPLSNPLRKILSSKFLF